ncbi:hypothetical protein OH76DRAFT_1334227, partial [Lentinus brumalis]
AQFTDLWASGVPMIVSGVDRRLQGSWHPNDFIREYGSLKVSPVNCVTDKLVEGTWKVATFFRCLENGSKDTVMKLKDWPPSKSFRTTFSDLFDGFCRSIPLPCQDIARVDGKLNLAAHFPKNGNAPDLGPKMYIATGSKDHGDTFGTTKLHLDVTDAINLLPWCADRKGAAAVWHIFAAESAPKLREFLLEYDADPSAPDPIHSQRFYLSDPMISELSTKKGVRPWIIYQRYGDAVFIPAGCAHQVRNLQSAIKVACDFVSLQNIDRTLGLLQEQRKHRLYNQGPEDVLQLHVLLWYAWIS